jgi:hypothetical protein
MGAPFRKRTPCIAALHNVCTTEVVRKNDIHIAKYRHHSAQMELQWVDQSTSWGVLPKLISDGRQMNNTAAQTLLWLNSKQVTEMVRTLQASLWHTCNIICRASAIRVFDTNGDEELSGANQIYRGSVSLLIRRLKSRIRNHCIILLYRVACVRWKRVTGLITGLTCNLQVCTIGNLAIPRVILIGHKFEVKTSAKKGTKRASFKPLEWPIFRVYRDVQYTDQIHLAQI